MIDMLLSAALKKSLQHHLVVYYHVDQGVNQTNWTHDGFQVDRQIKPVVQTSSLVPSTCLKGYGAAS